MTEPPTFSIAVVCEARADQATGCALADRMLCAQVDWLEGNLEQVRIYRGLLPVEPHLPWREVPGLARRRGIRVTGRFTGQDGHVARQALLLLVAADPRPDAVLLLRDSDGHLEERTSGLDGARAAQRWPFFVVIGVAHVMRECWVLAGFDPQDSDEAARLEAVRRQLGFDPRLHAERLTAKHGHDKLSAKRVLAFLCDHVWDREEACWTSVDVALLAQRGDQTRLRAFLDELQAHLVPLFTGG
ncbi:MAG TPA: hypothetical protein VLS89_15655 [Candidatus Nanopelagicales bacterium]|nr:hypothetical protein [Candidatus Nanopelagicales bacterium]